MATSPVRPSDTANIVPSPGDRACDTVSKFILALSLFDEWINFAVNGDGTATQDFLDWIGTGTGTTAGTLGAPAGLTASQNLTDNVTLSWGSVSGAVYYNVYRGETSDTNAMTLLAANQTVTSYVDTTPTTGTTYWYAIRAYSGTQISAMSSPASGVKKASGTPATLTLNYPQGTEDYHYVVPTGYTKMEVWAWGAGAPGSKPSGPNPQPAQATGAPIGGGGGGGGGSFNRVTNIAVAPGDDLYVRVGVSAASAAVNTIVFKGTPDSATFVSAPGGTAGTAPSGYSAGAGGAGGVLGSNTFGGGSINAAERTAGTAGANGSTTWGGAGGTGGAAITYGSLSYGKGGNGSYLVNFSGTAGDPGYVRLILTA